MSEGFKMEVPQEDISVSSVLGGLDKITAQDIKNFQDRILPDMMEVFDDLSSEQQEMLVLLDSCSDEELLYLIQHDKDNGRAMIIHDINQHLTVLEGLLDDYRVGRLRKMLDSQK